MRKYLAKLDWNNILMNKTAIECWNILKYEIEGIIDKFVLSNLCGGFIGVSERMKTMHIAKRQLMQVQLKLDNLKEAMNKN